MRLNYILAIFILLLLSSCNDNKACIASDDFGFDKVGVLSKPDNIYGERANQYIDWTETSLVTSGDPILMVVNGIGNTSDPDIIKYANTNSRWAPLYCEQSADNSKVCKDVAESTNEECIQVEAQDSIINPLCIFRNGVGLYGLLVPRDLGINNINDNKSYNLRPPSGCKTFHLGESKIFDHNGFSGLGGYKSGSTQAGQSLYLKILDSFYQDNSGSYEVIIKNGFINANGYPIASIITIFKEKMNQLSESIFKATIQNSDFTQPVKVTLILYIIILTISFMFGLIQVTHKEVAMRIIKVMIVAQLLTGDASYTFFKDYFFTFFIDGFDIVVGFVTSGLGNSSGGMTFFDLILGILLSYETNSKIMAFLFSPGFIIIPFLYIFLAIFIIAIFRAVVLYIISYIAITLLIAIAPVFLVFMLFQFTNSFFQNWLKQFGNYFFQPLIVFATIALFSVMIMSNFYKLLGNRICYNTVFEAFSTPILKFWEYEPINLFNSNGKPIAQQIDVPGYSIVNGKACAPYQCSSTRFLNAPFLDPADPDDIKYAQAKQDNDFNFLIPKSLYIILLAYLLHKMLDMLPAIAKGIAGTEYSQTDLSRASSSATSALKSVVSAPIKAIDTLTGGNLSKAAAKVKQVRGQVTEIINIVQDKVGGVIDKAEGNEFDVKPRTISEVISKKINQTMSATVGKGYDDLEDELNKTVDKALDKALGTKETPES